jgi:hypothetical protein
LKENLQQLVTLVGENPILKDSLIAEIFQVMLSGKEPKMPKQVVPGAVEIGDLNELEKAVMVICEQCADTEKEMFLKFDGEDAEIREEIEKVHIRFHSA